MKAAGRSHWMALCPAHDDREASLSVSETPAGDVLLHDFTGCTTEAVVAALDLTLADLFTRSAVGGGNGRRRGEGVHTSGKSAEPSNPGLTLAAFAAAKQLPEEFLRSCGITEFRLGGLPALRFPYRTLDGTEAAVRFRIALTGDRFRWRRGSKPQPYGFERLEQARAAGFVLIAEGESDTLTSWYHDVPALGIPGAPIWNDERDAPHLAGLDVFVVVEDDTGGEAVLRWVERSQLRECIRLVRLPHGIKDVSALHLDDPARFRERLQQALDAAQPWAALAALRASVEAREAEAEAGALLEDDDIVARAGELMTARGFAGDTRPAQIAYVIETSRFLPRPNNAAFVAPSAAGKNAAVNASTELMPPEAIYQMSAGSARALIYEDDDFTNRVVIVEEADAIPDEGPAASAIRSIAEEGVLRYPVVERDEQTGRFVTRRIEKPGPTVLITTSTRSLANQLGTRVLEVPIADTEAQTRAVMRAHARRAAGGQAEPPGVEAFVALQRWLALAGERRVVVPYAEALVDLIPAHIVRMRRDAAQLLTFVQAIALLHQRRRERAPDGAVVATIADYSSARELLLPVFDTISTEGVTTAVRETVQAIKDGEEVSEAELVRRLGLAKSSVSYRLGRALRTGFLVNNEPVRHRPKRLARGLPLPEARSALPDPEEVRNGFERSNAFREMYTPSPPRSGASTNDAPTGAGTVADEVISVRAPW